MPVNPLTTNTTEARQKQAELKASGRIQEDAAEREVIRRQYVQKAERQEQASETAQFETALHETPSAPYSVPPQGATGTALLEQVSAPKSEFLLAVESALADGVGDMYVRMEPNARAVFRQKGEEVARKIEAMVAAGKNRFKQIVALIKEWLRMIPGVNKFFLEQEAKIKADKIFAIAAA